MKVQVGFLHLCLVFATWSSCQATPFKHGTPDVAAWMKLSVAGQEQLSEHKYREAESSFRAALSSARRHDCNLLDLAKLSNFLGVALHSQGRDKEAIDQFNDALNGYSKGRDKLTIGRGKVLANLALCYSASNRFHEGIQCCEEALSIFKAARVSALEQSVLSNTYGRLLMDSGRLSKAEDAFSTAVSLRQSVLGTSSPELVSPLLNLSTVLLAEGKLAECDRVCGKAIGISESQSGPGNGMLFALLSNFARSKTEQLLFSDAQLALEKAIGIAEKSFGKSSPEVGVALFNLSQTYESGNEPEMAEKTLERALEIFRSTFGPGDEKTLDATDSLANLYEAHGKLSQSTSLRILSTTLRRSLNAHFGREAR